MKISLLVLCAGKAAGKALPINAAQFIIGRDPVCNLRPASTMISKKHCAVLVKGGQVLLRDFDSTNGTFLNDEQIKGEVPLKDGDVLRLGPLSFKMVIEGMPALYKQEPKAEVSPEDAAAALLSADEECSAVTMSMSETTEDQLLEGTTTDMPAYVSPEQKNGEKLEEKKPVGKAPVKTGAAQDAARAILEKMRAGRRK